jgi:poly(A) polymerase
VLDALEAGGARAWFVGGCVRDGLLGLVSGDIDIATDATPDRVTGMAEAAGLRPVPDRGGAWHVTVVADHVPVEVTTLRRDVATDGRRATVALPTGSRRTRTAAISPSTRFMPTRDGTVLDPTGEGLADLKARRVRFIGDPHDRIVEDYLRILRFFRFHAHGTPTPVWASMPTGSPPRRNLPRGSTGWRKERIGAEMRKLLAAPDPAPSVAAMARSGIFTTFFRARMTVCCRCWWRSRATIAARPDAPSRGTGGRGRGRCAAALPGRGADAGPDARWHGEHSRPR